MTTKHLLFVLPLIFIGLHVHAQEQLGLRLSNYSGINSTVLNPAYHSTTPFRWDVNLAEGALHFYNNYAYLKDTRVPTLIKQRASLEFALADDFQEGNTPGPNTVVVDFYNFNRSRNVYTLASVMGPSFYLRLGERHTVGLVTRARVVASARGIDNGLSYYQYDPKPFFQDINVSPFRGATASWSEIGFNYAYSQPTNNGTISFGTTIKALQAYEGGYIRNEDRFLLQKLPNDSLAASAVNFSYAYSGTSLEGEKYTLPKNGNGLAIDLGFTYTIEGNSYALYDWKFGAALLDLGQLTFKENARAHQISVEDPVAIATEAYQNIQGFEDAESYIEYFSFQVLNDSTASTTGDAFSIGLPAAFSLQASKSIGSYGYLDAAFVQGFPLGDAALQRGSMLSVVPRFEHRWFEAALPLTVYDWSTARVGLAVRLAFLTIGTDHLGSFVTDSDLYGSDLYFAIKLNPFSIGRGGEGRGTRRVGSRKGGKVKCYEF
jgi:hypothetical protein